MFINYSRTYDVETLACNYLHIILLYKYIVKYAFLHLFFNI